MSATRLGIVGAGRVGQALAGAFTRAGHSVVFGVRDPADPRHAALGAPALSLAGMRDACEVIVLATPWDGAQSALEALGDCGGRVLLDVTNPLGPGLALTHGHDDSGGEQVQRWAPTARVVKAFNSTGAENMADPRYGAQRAVMFVCGDDEAACETARALAADIGFDAHSIGPLAQARLLEPLARLWIELALVRGHGRSMAFTLLTR